MPGPSRPITVTHQSGVRFAIAIGPHTLVVDQPPHGGGGDAGPTPIQLLGASLGGCIALYVRQFCEARSLTYAGMRVDVAQEGAQHPNRVARFAVRITLPEPLPEPYVEMLERVVQSCPAYNTLDRGAEIVIEHGAAVQGATAD